MRVALPLLTMLVLSVHSMRSPTGKPLLLATQALPRLSGTVEDINNSRVVGATITIEGERSRTVLRSTGDGTYEVEVPVGTFRVRATRPGFCPGSRGPFYLEPGKHAVLNFTLIPCPIVNELTISNDKFAGETDRYKDPFSMDVFPLNNSSGLPLEVVVRFGARRDSGSAIVYGGAAIRYEASADSASVVVEVQKYVHASVSYNLLLIRAEIIRFYRDTFRVEAEGGVLVEDGVSSRVAKRVVADLRSNSPLLELVP